MLHMQIQWGVALIFIASILLYTRMQSPLSVAPVRCLETLLPKATADATPCRHNVFSQAEYKTRVVWLEKYLAKNNAPVVEGHSGQVDAQLAVYERLFGWCNVRNIAEIGFNAGHSTLTMLMANPVARIQSFDLGEHPSARAALAALKRQYPLRDFGVIWGDSRTTVPAFTKTYTGPKFDVLIVDGGHTYDIARADVLSMRALAHGDTTLVVDDTICGEHFCVDKVLDDLEREGVIRVTERVPLSFYDRGLTLARYVM